MGTIEIISVIGIAIIAFIQSYRVIIIRKQLFNVEESFKDACIEIARLKEEAGAPKTVSFILNGDKLTARLNNIKKAG